MSKGRFSPIFVSHGAPTMPLEDIPAKDFLVELGTRYKNVGAVLCVSAHWTTSQPAVNAVERPETIHDFYGFPSELYDINYPAEGSPELAEKTAELIKASGMPCTINENRGLDHGAWVPMSLMFPDADIPAVQLSIQEHLDPLEHYDLGLAIKELASENILILGSGGAVHPLGYAPLGPGARTDSWAVEFDDWLTKAVENGNDEALKKYREIAPYPERAHLYPDHFMPLLTALGAAGEGARGEVIHHSWYWGDLGMAAYRFEKQGIN